MDFVITAGDREQFKRCRRAWDFGSSIRRSLEPKRPRPLDPGAAIREGLAVYYFPGMWEWSNRTIPERLAVEAFDRVLRRQLGALPETTPEIDREWEEASEHGRALLRRYFRWAPTIDRFSPIRVNTDFAVTIPDPDDPDVDLVSVEGRRLVYSGTIDMLVIDRNEAYWLVQHRLTTGDWLPADLLALDDRYSSFCWAWERFFLGMAIAGVIYNELRTDAPDDAGAAPEAGDEAAAAGGPTRAVSAVRRMYLQAAAVPTGITQHQDGPFRRTQVPRPPRELAALRRQMAAEALEMSDPAVSLYPAPSPHNCGTCDFRAPCIEVNEGGEPDRILQASYRTRPPPEAGTEPRIGSATWSQNRGAAPMGWQERIQRPSEAVPQREGDVP
jgi:hypothetical protein